MKNSIKNKENKKAIIVSISVLAGLGALYYFLIYKKDAKAENEKGKYAEFINDGFVYTVGTKAQAYAKKVGEFGGYKPKTYKEDKDYWIATNSKKQEILLKKSDVKIL